MSDTTGKEEAVLEVVAEGQFGDPGGVFIYVSNEPDPRYLFLDDDLGRAQFCELLLSQIGPGTSGKLVFIEAHQETP